MLLLLFNSEGALQIVSCHQSKKICGVQRIYLRKSEGIIEIKKASDSLGLLLWELRDSNPRPSRLHRDALNQLICQCLINFSIFFLDFHDFTALSLA
jgi:hypothetical protein